MSDINPAAIRNTLHNLERSPQPAKGTLFESDLFESIPSTYRHHFDIIYFNPPFHNEPLTDTDTALAYAFKEQSDRENVLARFLDSAREYLAPGGVIYIGFSNKDKTALALLEASLSRKNYAFEVVEHINADTVADNRIYRVQEKTA